MLVFFPTFFADSWSRRGRTAAGPREERIDLQPGPLPAVPCVDDRRDVRLAWRRRWFGGTAEGRPDVGIWLSRYDGRQWSAPVEVANGVVSAEERYPCWNPVLFQPQAGPLLLFYKTNSRKAGPGPSHWLGRLITSVDGGRSWSAPRSLPEGIIGPVKNKPLELPGGELLCPSSTEHAGWRVHFEVPPTWAGVGRPPAR